MPKISSIDIIELSSASEPSKEAEKQRAQLAADLDWVRQRGVRVVQTFVAKDVPVADDEQQAVPARPHPLTIVDGTVALSGRYPTRQELGIWMMFGLVMPDEKGGMRACTL